MITLKNYARKSTPRQNMDWFSWKVFVDGPPEEIAAIDEVEYTLHPTFPQPIQKVKNNQDRFALSSSGWGEFTIRADVHYKDGRKKTLTHWVDFDAGWPSS